ncbi:hypothetical protein FJZ17_03730 [Candidatus Pacearchaeota archaeon]|nr:hypothetical protein [Candidatus Pacearchaeota archaeon]
MKFNFKKIASVLATTVMLGSTVAFAAAAWPAPFVSSGAADAAVVYGATSADLAAAADLGAALDKSVTVSSGTISGDGDKYLLEKTSTKLQLGNGITDVVSSAIDDDELPTLLKEGKYMDDDNDEFDYTQKITLANSSVTMFEDNDYKSDEPTVGIRIASAATVLNYSLEFTDQPLWTDLETTDIPMMGKEYYVLDAVNITSLTLLDSAEKVTLSEGETKTVTIGSKSYETSIAFIGSTSVKLTVNGQTTNSLATGNTFKLSDGTYVGIREINTQDYAGGIKQVEFGIGSGKLKLTNGADVEINDNSIPRLGANLTSSSDGKLSQIRINWAADGDLFVAPGKEAEMPGFKAVKLVWGGFEMPKEEVITVKSGGDDYIMLDNFPLDTSTEDIDVLYTNSTANYTGYPGKAADKQLRTSNSTVITFDTDTDQYFVASWADSRDSESYLMRATSFKVDNNINKTTLEYRKDGAWKEFGTDKKEADTASIGSVELTLGDVDYNGKSVVLTITSGSFNTLYSAEGLKVYLPWQTTMQQATGAVNCSAITWTTGLIGPVVVTNATASANATCYQSTYALAMVEENKDGDVASGRQINFTLGFNSASTPEVSMTGVVGESSASEEIGSTDVFRSFVYSALASEMLFDKSGDQDWAKLIYHGGQSIAKVYLTAPSVTSGASGAIRVVKDTEVDSVKSMNLVVVGGSCINTVAAKILGSETPVCGAAWAEKTGAGAGKYLVQVAASPVNSAKIAMLVAGYDAADTVNAVAKVKEGQESTAVGKKVYPLSTA